MTPEYWKTIKYCDWLAGKHPEIPSVFWCDDMIGLREEPHYEINKDGRYDLVSK